MDLILLTVESVAVAKGLVTASVVETSQGALVGGESANHRLL